MKKLIAIPAFDEDGVLNGIDLVASIHIPDEATISDGINEISELPKIIFDVSNTERTRTLSLPANESTISKAKLFLRSNLSGHFLTKTTKTASSLR